MSEQLFGPWPIGIDNTSDPLRLPRDDRGTVRALADAVNVDISDAGDVERRNGWALRLASAGAHSIWHGKNAKLAGVGNQLVSVSVSGDTVAATNLLTLPSARPLSFTDLNEGVLFSSNDFIGKYVGGVAKQLGVEEPGAFTASAAAAGGLYAGRYGIVVTQIDGTEESAASALQQVDVAEGGGIRLSGLAHQLPLRVYRTDHNGDALYRCADIPVGMTEFVIGAGALGRICETRHMARMIPGHIVRVFNGMTVVARGRNLYFSQPMRYGLYSPRHGFVQFPYRIWMVRPVDAGIWVGHAGGVQFLRGNGPGSFELIDTSALPPLQGADAEIDSAALSGDFKTGATHAVWLAGNGFVLGMATGQLVEPQANRIRLSGSSGGVAVNGRRVTAIVQ